MTHLLEQGGFGCVYYPGINCTQGKILNNSKVVTKLVVNDFTADNEIYIGFFNSKNT